MRHVAQRLDTMASPPLDCSCSWIVCCASQLHAGGNLLIVLRGCSIPRVHPIQEEGATPALWCTGCNFHLHVLMCILMHNHMHPACTGVFQANCDCSAYASPWCEQFDSLRIATESARKHVFNPYAHSSCFFLLLTRVTAEHGIMTGGLTSSSQHSCTHLGCAG